MAVRTYAAQKSGLTRVVNRWHKLHFSDQAQDARFGHNETAAAALRKACQDVLAECKRVVAEWNAGPRGYWPDDWHRWNIALSDCSFDWGYVRQDDDEPFPYGLEDL